MRITSLMRGVSRCTFAPCRSSVVLRVVPPAPNQPTSALTLSTPPWCPCLLCRAPAPNQLSVSPHPLCASVSSVPSVSCRLRAKPTLSQPSPSQRLRGIRVLRVVLSPRQANPHQPPPSQRLRGIRALRVVLSPRQTNSQSAPTLSAPPCYPCPPCRAVTSPNQLSVSPTSQRLRGIRALRVVLSPRQTDSQSAPTLSAPPWYPCPPCRAVTSPNQPSSAPTLSAPPWYPCPPCRAVASPNQLSVSPHPLSASVVSVSSVSCCHLAKPTLISPHPLSASVVSVSSVSCCHLAKPTLISPHPLSASVVSVSSVSCCHLAKPTLISPHPLSASVVSVSSVSCCHLAKPTLISPHPLSASVVSVSSVSCCHAPNQPSSAPTLSAPPWYPCPPCRASPRTRNPNPTSGGDSSLQTALSL